MPSAAVLVAGVMLLAVALRPPVARGPIEAGIDYLFVTYDLVLPLLGLGVALVHVTRWHTPVHALVVAGGVALGVYGERRLASMAALITDPTPYFAYLGPLCCLLVGAVLALPDRPRHWLLPVTAAVSGVALGLLAAFHDPTQGDPRFAAAVAAAGLWLIAAPSACLRWFDVSWLRIGGRILASWLVAMGLLIGGSKFVVQNRAERAQVPMQPYLQPPTSIDPGDPDDSRSTLRPRVWPDGPGEP